MSAERPLELLALERGLAAPEELERMRQAGASPLVLAGRLVALGRLPPEELPAFLAEAERRARACPHCRQVLLLPLGARPVPCPGCGKTPPAEAGFATLVTELELPGSGAEPAGGSTAAGSGVVRDVAFEPGKRIGRYQVLEELGRGAMGVVYRVKDTVEGAERALKLLLGGERASSARRQRFEGELRLLLRLDHPGLVKVRDGGLADGAHPYLVMDLVPGRDLSDVIRGGSLTVEQAARIVRDLARAVDHAHLQGVLHRDLKPENVRVDPDLRPTLIDFGLAKDMEEEGGLTRTGMQVGTPYYMAPEQIAGRIHEVDPRSDVWAMGVLLFELLTREVPFQGQGNDALTRRIQRADPPKLQAMRADVPLALEQVVERALQKRREDRWESAAELAEALDRVLEGLRAGPPAGARPWPRRALLPAGVAAAAGLALLLALRGPGADPTQSQGGTPPAPAPPPPTAEAPGPGPGLEAARRLAREGRRDEALRALGAAGEGSFLRAERRLLLRGDDPLGAAIALALAAEAGRDRRAAARARELLGDPAWAGSPAAQEARARAALVLHDAEGAAVAAAAALAAAPDEPEALRAAAWARAAALQPEALRQDLARLEGAEGSEALAAAWQSLARELSIARERELPGSPAEDAARLAAASGWWEAATRLVRAGRPAEDPALEAAREAGRRELSPLLARVPAARVRAARRALVEAGRAGAIEALEAAEADLGAAARELEPRRDAALGAVLLAASLGGREARGWAEAWLGLAGDRPARALLALVSAVRAEDPRERLRQLERARDLAPELPLVQLASVQLAAGRDAGLGARDGPALRALAAAASGAPELLPSAWQGLEARPLEPAELEAALGADALRGDDPAALLGRALARVHARELDPAGARAAIGEARAAAAAAGEAGGGAAAAHLVLALALRRAGAGPVEVERALELAAAAAPAAAGPARLRLRGVEAPSLEQLEPLLLRGHVGRLAALLAEAERRPALPAALQGLPADLGRLPPPGLMELERGVNRPLVSLAMRLAPRLVTPSRRDLAGASAWTRSPRLRDAALARAETWLAQARELLDPDGPERWALEALARRPLAGRPGTAKDPGQRQLLNETAAALLRGIAAAAPPGALLHPDQLRGAGLLPPSASGPAAELLPDAPELAWTWWAEMRRPGLLRLRLAETRQALEPTGSSPLAEQELADPCGPGRALLEAVQSQEASEWGAEWLLLAGEREEALLASVRAAAFARGPRDVGDAWRDAALRLAEERLYGADAAASEDLDLIEGLLSEGLARWGGLREDRARLSAELCDLLLWRAGLTAEETPERAGLLSRARAAAADVDPALLGPWPEPPLWTHWRLVRLHAALGERQRAEEQLRRVEEAGRSVVILGEWRRRAILRDPLRPALEELPGYKLLLEAVTPRQ